jgi:hypothetical protein
LSSVSPVYGRISASVCAEPAHGSVSDLVPAVKAVMGGCLSGFLDLHVAA